MSRNTTICLLVLLLVPGLVWAAPKHVIGNEGGGSRPGYSGPIAAPQPTARPPVPVQPQPQRPPQPQAQPQPRPQAESPSHIIGAQEPSHPGRVILPGPDYTRPEREHQRYSYPSRDRAYSIPPRRHDDYHGHYDNDWNGWYGGWYSGWGWNYGPGWYNYPYYDPWPREVIVTVPGPTVYVPVPAPDTAPPPAAAPNVDPATLPILGCDITAGDGKFLGTIDREYTDPESIANPQGQFGNRGSELSIWNPAGKYGSPTSDYSPWNPQAKYPPMLTWHGAFKAYLTVSEEVKPAIPPEALSQEIGATPWR